MSSPILRSQQLGLTKGSNASRKASQRSSVLSTLPLLFLRLTRLLVALLSSNAPSSCLVATPSLKILLWCRFSCTAKSNPLRWTLGNLHHPSLLDCLISLRAGLDVGAVTSSYLYAAYSSPLATSWLRRSTFSHSRLWSNTA